MIQKIKEIFYTELNALPLWHGVFLAVGIGIYFALPEEPVLWISLLTALGAGFIWFLGRKEFVSRLILGYVFLACLGFSVAALKAHMVAAPVLSRSLYDVKISGKVVRLEPKDYGSRLTLDNVKIENLAAHKTPQLIRVNFQFHEPVIRVGDHVSGYGHLYPPMMPVQIGAYDFSKTAWFMRIGAVGKMFDLTDLNPDENPSEVSDKLERLRQTIMHKVQTVLPSSSASIAIPLIIGEQGLVTDEMYDLYRQAGIVHVLSVSGFHLTLLAGLVFFLIRGFLALFPGLDGHLHTKKIAALLSLGIVFFYLLISGLQVPAIRSFIMIAIVLLAVLLDRNALSLRSVMVAAGAILFIWPEMLISASFQLSFMAVFALVSLYEVIMRRFYASRLRHSLWYKGVILLWGMVLVSLLAGMATAPFAAYHFNQFAPYSILGNLMTSVLFSFAIMPLLLAAVVMMPFGYEGIFLKGAGFCLDKITDICRWITSLPYADVTVPAFDTWGLIVMSFGFLMVFLMKTNLRWLGFVVAAMGLMAFQTIDRPDILVAEGGKLVGVRQADGTLKLSDPAGNIWAADTWLKRNGQNLKLYKGPYLEPERVEVKGKKIAFDSLHCFDADLTFMLKYGIGDCVGPVIKRKELWQNKTHEVYILPEGIHIKTVRQAAGNRLWTSFLLAPKEKTNYTDH